MYGVLRKLYDSGQCKECFGMNIPLMSYETLISLSLFGGVFYDLPEDDF